MYLLTICLVFTLLKSKDQLLHFMIYRCKQLFLLSMFYCFCTNDLFFISISKFMLFVLLFSIKMFLIGGKPNVLQSHPDNYCLIKL